MHPFFLNVLGGEVWVGDLLPPSYCWIEKTNLYQGVHTPMGVSNAAKPGSRLDLGLTYEYLLCLKHCDTHHFFYSSCESIIIVLLEMLTAPCSEHPVRQAGPLQWLPHFILLPRPVEEERTTLSPFC